MTVVLERERCRTYSGTERPRPSSPSGFGNLGMGAVTDARVGTAPALVDI